MCDRETIKRIAAEILQDRPATENLLFEFANRLVAEMVKGSEPAPRFVPDSECKQGRCGNTTTGCVGTCKLDDVLGPSAWMLDGEVYTVKQHRLGDDTEIPGQIPLYAHRQTTHAADGKVLVPLRLTRAMREVVERDDWEWGDLLAAAEAVTEEEQEIANRSGSEPVAYRWRDGSDDGKPRWGWAYQTDPRSVRRRSVGRWRG